MDSYNLFPLKRHVYSAARTPAAVSSLLSSNMGHMCAPCRLFFAIVLLCCLRFCLSPFPFPLLLLGYCCPTHPQSERGAICRASADKMKRISFHSPILSSPLGGVSHGEGQRRMRTSHSQNSIFSLKGKIRKLLSACRRLHATHLLLR